MKPEDLKFNGISLVDFGEMLTDCGVFLADLSKAIEEKKLSHEDEAMAVLLTTLPLLAFHQADSLFTQMMKRKIELGLHKKGSSPHSDIGGIPINPSSDKS